MRLNKKIKDDILAGAQYTENGIALRLSRNGDKFMNSVALIECVNGEIRLTIFDDAVERYGVKIQHEEVRPKEW